MIRKLVAGVALTGSLVFGAAGMAGATSTTTSSTPAAGTATTHATLCAKASKRAALLQARETKAATFVTKAQARESKATAGNHPKVAKLIARRITRVQKLERRGDKMLATISSKCGTPAG